MWLDQIVIKVCGSILVQFHISTGFIEAVQKPLKTVHNWAKN